MCSAREAVAFHIEGMLMDGETIAEQKLIGFHQASEDYEGGVWTEIEVDLSKLSL